MISKLIKLANDLDKKGLYSEASEIDEIVKMAIAWPWQGNEPQDFSYKGDSSKSTLRDDSEQAVGELDREEFKKTIQRARGKTVRISDLSDPLSQNFMARNNGGAAYWCDKCRGVHNYNGRGPTGQADHPWSPKDLVGGRQGLKERQEAESRFGRGSGSYIEGQIVQLLGGIAYMKDEKIKNILKKARKPVDRYVTNAWDVLEESIIPPGSYNAAIMMMAGMSNDPWVDNSIKKAWPEIRNSLSRVSNDPSTFKKILQNGFSTTVLKIQQLLRNSQVQPNSYKTVIDNILVKIK